MMVVINRFSPMETYQTVDSPLSSTLSMAVQRFQFIGIYVISLVMASSEEDLGMADFIAPSRALKYAASMNLIKPFSIAMRVYGLNVAMIGEGSTVSSFDIIAGLPELKVLV